MREGERYRERGGALSLINLTLRACAGMQRLLKPGLKTPVWGFSCGASQRERRGWRSSSRLVWSTVQNWGIWHILQRKCSAMSRHSHLQEPQGPTSSHSSDTLSCRAKAWICTDTRSGPDSETRSSLTCHNACEKLQDGCRKLRQT